MFLFVLLMCSVPLLCLFFMSGRPSKRKRVNPKPFLDKLEAIKTDFNCVHAKKEDAEIIKQKLRMRKSKVSKGIEAYFIQDGVLLKQKISFARRQAHNPNIIDICITFFSANAYLRRNGSLDGYNNGVYFALYKIIVGTYDAKGNPIAFKVEAYDNEVRAISKNAGKCSVIMYNDDPVGIIDGI